MATTIERHFPELAEAEEPAPELLRCVAGLQADLIARWLSVGFIHGVMNTDNMALSGETIDYGPCAFLDAYHPDTVFAAPIGLGRSGTAMSCRSWAKALSETSSEPISRS